MKTRNIVGVVGDVTAFLLLAAPGSTFWDIVKAKTVEGRTCYPYLATLLNCICWVVYGIPRKNWVVVGINGVGIAVEGVYCALYIAYSTGTRRVVAIALFIAEFVVAAILVTILLTVFRHGHNADAREMAFGVLGSLTGALMYVSPVMDMVNVIKSKDKTKHVRAPCHRFIRQWRHLGGLRTVQSGELVLNALGILCASAQMVVYFLASLKLCCFKPEA